MAKKTKAPHGKKRPAEKTSQSEKQHQFDKDAATTTKQRSSFSNSRSTSTAALSLAVIVAAILAFLVRNRTTKSKEEAMIDWIRGNGGVVHEKVSIRSDDEVLGLRGVFVDAALKQDESFMSVPESCFFSIQTIRDGKTQFSNIVQGDPGLMEAEIQTVQLALALMVEMRSNNSFWRPYFDVLPTTYPDQPLFWDDNQLDELQSPIVQLQIQQSKRFLESKLPLLQMLSSRYATLGFSDNDEKLLEEFVWAYYTVISRSFDVPGKRDSRGNPDPDDFVTGLVPLADLLNHGFGEPTAKQSITLTMPKRILQYSSSVTVPLPANSELVWKYHQASKAPSTKNILRYGMVDRDLERAEADYIVLRSANKEWAVTYDGSIIGWKDNDDLTKEILPKVEAAIQALPTSLKEDEAILISSDDASRRLAVLLRMRYKRVLHNLLARLHSGAPQFTGQSDDLDRRASLALVQINIS